MLKKGTPNGAAKVVSGQENWRQIGRGEGRQPSKNQCLNLPKSFPIHLGNYKVWNPSKKYPSIGNVEDPYFNDTTIGEVGFCLV